MSLVDRLFRPGRGRRAEHFTAAFLNGDCHGGDAVMWDTTAPTLQGPDGDGRLEGEILTATDFVYVVQSGNGDGAGGNVSEYKVAGIARGQNFEMDPIRMMGDDQLVHVQTWGVCPIARVDSTSISAGAFLGLSQSTTGAGHLTVVPYADAYLYAQVGFALTDDFTYTRGTAINSGVTMFIRGLCE